MTRLFRRFWPAFFERFDRWMLMNYPRLWTTRLHGLLFAVAGLLVLTALKVLMVSDAHVPNVEVDFMVLCIISGLVWLGWMISMYAFRPGKYPGSRQSGLQYVISVLVGTLIVASVPIMYGYGVNYKLSMEDDFSYYSEKRVLDFGGHYWTYHDHAVNSGYHYQKHRNTKPFNSYMTEQKMVEIAMNTLQQYGGDFNGVTSETLLLAHKKHAAMHPGFKEEVEKAYTNLKHKRDAFYLFDQWRSYPSFRSEVTHILLFVFMLIGLLGVVFQHASLRQFVWALIAFGAIFLTVALLAFVNDISNTFKNDELLSSLILASYVAVGLIAFGGIKRFVKMRKAALILLGLALPFMGLVLGFFGDEVLDINLKYDLGLRDHYQTMWWGCVVPAMITFALWVTVFIPQLQKLQTHPTRK